MANPLARIPVVGGLGYVERVRRLPSAFSATLVPEADNRYFRHAVAVVVNGEKVGYLAPEVAARYYGPLTARTGAPAACPARRGSTSDHETCGVELLLDFTGIDVEAAE